LKNAPEKWEERGRFISSFSGQDFIYLIRLLKNSLIGQPWMAGPSALI
jgi:hypothetical protein